MQKFLKRWLIIACAVGVASRLVSGIHYDALTDLIVASLLLGILNAVVRPIMLVLSLPFVLMTLGLFILVINAVLLYFVGHFVRGFHVDSFGAAFWGSLIVAIVSLVMEALFKSGDSQRKSPRNHNPPPPPPRQEPPPGQGPVIDV